ncbi:MAG TPA: carboxylesterase family protein [Candidatus Dormibacteraeota bacterium]
MDAVVKTRHGAVRGRVTDGVAAFKGIPYAAPPFGPARFGPPAPPAPWTGIRDAHVFGPTAPQWHYPQPFDQLLPNPLIPGEDCLNLNVWTPEPGPAGLPVMVWIHGGAFANGSGAVPTYDGSRFARDGVMCVTLNYRLGVEGFAQLAGAPPNRGLLDQVAALEWVRDNAAAFGGDPDRVTIFGESAGAMSVTSLLAMPRAHGLFHRAIAQSGAGHHAVSPATAEKVAAMLAARLGVAATREAMAGLPPARVLEAQMAVSTEARLDRDPERWGEVALNNLPWEPVVDGDVLPRRPVEAVAAGSAAGVELLIGSNTDEQRLFLVPTGMVDRVTEEQLHIAAAGYGLGAGALATYRASRPAATPGDLLAAVVTDWTFRIPALRLAEAHGAAGGASHVYEFAWASPRFEGRLGACHYLEVGFVFDRVGPERALTGTEPPQGLAAAMHGSWTAFARTGDPGWPAYDVERRTTMTFDERCRVVEDPRPDERRLWEGIR